MGYQYGNVFEKNPFSYTTAAFNMSAVPGNRGLTFTCCICKASTFKMCYCKSCYLHWW